MNNYITVTDLYRNKDKYKELKLSCFYDESSDLSIETIKAFNDIKMSLIKKYEKLGKDYLLDCVIKGVGYAYSLSIENLKNYILDADNIFKYNELSISTNNLLKIIKYVNPEYDLSDLNDYMIDTTICLAKEIALEISHSFDKNKGMTIKPSLLEFSIYKTLEKGEIIEYGYIFSSIPYIYILNIRKHLSDKEKQIFDKSILDNFLNTINNIRVISEI